jgi:hypothetical protein
MMTCAKGQDWGGASDAFQRSEAALEALTKATSAAARV